MLLFVFIGYLMSFELGDELIGADLPDLDATVRSTEGSEMSIRVDGH